MFNIVNLSVNLSICNNKSEFISLMNKFWLFNRPKTQQTNKFWLFNRPNVSDAKVETLQSVQFHATSKLEFIYLTFHSFHCRRRWIRIFAKESLSDEQTWDAYDESAVIHTKMLTLQVNMIRSSKITSFKCQSFAMFNKRPLILY